MMDKSELEKQIKIAALENATKFDGKANQGAIIGKLFSLDPNLKSQMKEISPIINQILGEINSMSAEDQKEMLLKLNPDFEKQQEEKKKVNKESRSDLPPLRNAVDGKVVMRIAPEPSKYNHIGHAISFLINYMYAKRHQGKCILRFDDTNPEKESQEYVDAMLEDCIKYLDIQVDQTVYASDYIDQWTKMTDKLIEDGKAYACNCPSESISQDRRNMTDCPHRSQTPNDANHIWNEMKVGRTPGGTDYVIRLKIDMAHKNAVMRDPVIFRIITTPHYRQGTKYSVWPMYDFECAVIEAQLGVTHVLRSNEFESRIELQNYIREVCGFKNHPEIKQYARFEITGAITQGREIRAKIEAGEYSGWDDIRLVTLKALKRRGIVKDAYYDLSKVIGMSKANSNLDFSVIAAINRRLLNDSAKRFFFIKNPVAIRVEGAPKRELVLDMHPDNKSLGTRRFVTNEDYLLEKEDHDKFAKGKMVRLIDNLNFVDEKYAGDDYNTFKSNGDQIIHFLPADPKQLTEVEILMPDATTLSGIAEKNIESLKVGECIQFQRFGFCRLDEIRSDGKRVFWYTHD